MNRRHCVITALMMMIGNCALGARGDGTTPSTSTAIVAPVTPALLEYSGPTTAGIRAFIDPNVKNLLLDSDPAQGRSRTNLIAATRTAGAPASAAFLLEYGRQLDAAFMPLLAAGNKTTARQRLNIAIVVSGVAEVAQNLTLQNTTLALINDPTEPVVIWGLRAAQPQISTALTNKGFPPPVQLISTIGPAAEKHPSGAVYDEAYKALDIADPAVVKDLMKLWRKRLDAYEKDVPLDPVVDGRPVFTMTTTTMWTLVIVGNKNMQRDVMQNLSDQLSLAAQWADKSPPGDTKEQLVRLVQLCGGGCTVVAGTAKIQALDAAAAPLTRMNGANPIAPTANLAIAEIAKAFKVQPPPVIPGGAGGGAGGNVAAHP